MSRILFIAARVIAICGVLFISMFALDSFGTGAPFYQELIGFGIHLIPSYVLVAILLVAWRWPLVGGLIYLGLSVVPFIALRDNELWVNALLIAPFVLCGALFIAGALLRRPEASSPH